MIVNKDIQSILYYAVNKCGSCQEKKERHILLTNLQCHHENLERRVGRKGRMAMGKLQHRNAKAPDQV